MPGHRRHHRGSQRHRRRDRGQDGARRRADRGGASGRALRDHPLRHAHRLGEAARPQRRREAAGENLKEEKATDKKLDGIATRKINKKALARREKNAEANLERAENTVPHRHLGHPGDLKAVRTRRRRVRQHFAHHRRGSASPAVRRVWPSARPSAPRAARHVRHRRQLEREMREHMRDDAGQLAPFGLRLSAALAAPPRSKSCAQSLPGTSVMAPSRPFSGRVRSSTQPSARSATKAAPRRTCLRASAPCAEMSPGRRARAPRRLVPRTQRAGRPLRRADGGAEIHQRLREIAGASRRHQRRRQLRISRLGRRQRLFDGEEPRHHALDIAVDRHGRASKAIAAIAAAV